MKIGNGTFYHGDCLVEMSKIPDQSVDLILADLPYQVLPTLEWDKIIDWEPLWEHYWRVLKPNRPIVLTAQFPFTAKMYNSQPEAFKLSMIWEKNNAGSFTHAKNAPLKTHEDILVFSKGKIGHEGQSKNRMPYNPQGIQYAPRVVKNTPGRAQGGTFGSRPSHKETYIQEYTNYPGSVLKFDTVRDIHATQKPVELFEYLIKSFSSEGEMVLDNTAGSGTTAIAAEKTKRNWICIERDDDYYAKATERVKNFVGGSSEEDKDTMFY